MKFSITFILILLFFNIYSQDINVGISIRPLSSIIDSEDNFYATDSTNQIIKTNSFHLKSRLNFEIVNSNLFFHNIIFGYDFYKNIGSNNWYLSNNIISSKNRNNITNTFMVGYGFGKYYNIYKEKIFIKLQNNLLGKYNHSKEIDIEKKMNTAQDVISELNTKVSPVDIFSLEYELKPSLYYNINFFSIGVGIPLGIEFNTYNGEQVVNLKSTTNNSILEREYIIKKKANYFYFKYDIELSLRFHFNKTIK